MKTTNNRATRNIKKQLLFGILLCGGISLTHAQTYILYGTTYGGGSHGMGTVFSYDISRQTENVVMDFVGTNGNGPLGTLVQDKTSGILYGTAIQGGSNNDGVLFGIDPSTGEDSTLITFNDSTGKWPMQGGLLQYNNSLYGMTEDGGTTNDGALFRYTPAAGKDTVLLSFHDSTGKEYSPLGVGLTVCPTNGLFYGMTSSGGQYGNGAIFYFNPLTMKDSVLLSFDSANGAYPNEGSLVYDAAKHLFYGVTSMGGSYNSGVLFSYDPLTGKDSTLVSFDTLNGNSPYGGLTLDTVNGLLYGMTNMGGAYNMGVLYSFNPDSGTQTVLYNFDDTTGSYPTGNVVVGPGGKLFGTTNNDITGNGVLFSYDPVQQKYKVLYIFDYANGSAPYGSLTLVTTPALYPNVVSSVNEVSNTNKSVVYPNPSTGQFYVTNLAGDNTIDVYNTLGQKVQTAKEQGTQASFNISNQPSGVYYVKVTKEGKEVQTQAVVKQ